MVSPAKVSLCISCSKYCILFERLSGSRRQQSHSDSLGVVLFFFARKGNEDSFIASHSDDDDTVVELQAV